MVKQEKIDNKKALKVEPWKVFIEQNLNYQEGFCLNPDCHRAISKFIGIKTSLEEYEVKYRFTCLTCGLESYFKKDIEAIRESMLLFHLGIGQPSDWYAYRLLALSFHYGKELYDSNIRIKKILKMVYRNRWHHKRKLMKKVKKTPSKYFFRK